MPSQYLKYRVKSNENEAEGVHTLRFEPILGEVPKYEAGQFFMIKNLNLDEEFRPKIKPYSALHVWRANELSFGVKVHKNFSVELCKLQPNQEVEISGPFGFFVLPKEIDYPIVFLAGGIGITPLITMIEKLVAMKHGREYYMFYSNREEKDIAYRKELEKLDSENENFKLVFVMTGEGEFDFECDKGRISVEMIKKYVAEFDEAQFYMCASEGFVEGMKNSLSEAGVAKERIHTEKW